MIVARTFRNGHRALGVYLSESQHLVVYYRPKTSRKLDQGWVDVAQMLDIAWWHDRRKRRVGWEPRGAWALYLLVGAVVRLKEVKL